MANTNDSSDKEDNLSPEERIAWLRERGIQVETPEDRRRAQVSKVLQEEDELSYVLVPADSSSPLQELTFKVAAKASSDLLAEHLKPAFASGRVDLELLRDSSSGAATLTASDDAKVSDESLRKVAAQGNVETFSLVHATPTNNFTGINIYLDEGEALIWTMVLSNDLSPLAGMLKRLPLNTRATEYAIRAGFDPPPTFYGDVFLGRILRTAGMTRNTSFRLGEDSAYDAPWLQTAATDNLSYQMEQNSITGRSVTQPTVAGTEGKGKQEEGYMWTQTEQELEVVVPVETAKQIQVKFLPRILEVTEAGKVLVHLRLFERVDVDGCTWTVEAAGTDNKKLVVTMEKGEEALWPRIRD